MYTVKLNSPAFKKGQELDLFGVGLIKNGGQVKLEKDAEEFLVAQTGMSVKEYFKDNEMVEVTGTTELKGGDD